MKRKLALTLIAIPAVVGVVAWGLSAPHYADVSRIKDAGRQPGDVIAVEPLGGHNRLVIRAMLWWADLPVKVPITDGAEMFRVRYWSENNGQPVEASGLIALPFNTLGGDPSRGTVMYFHGTSPAREDSPSNLSVQGVVPSAIFAGGGYTLLAPDYIGLGTSRAHQTYLLAAPTIVAARDLVTALQHVGKAMKIAYSPDLYLTGFSQGGYSTAVVQRAFEATPVPGVTVRAGASIAGAFDLVKISVPYAFKFRRSYYLSYLAHSYAVQYNRPLGSLLTQPYAATLPKLFDGDHDVDTIMAGLPKNPRDMFLPERLAEMDAGKPNWFTVALAQNEAFNWVPKAPLRLYYGDRDVDVSPEDSKNFQAISAKAGGNISLRPMGPYDHSTVPYHGAPLARLWFDELSSAAQRK